MFGLDLSHLSPSAEGAVEAFILVFLALILFLLVSLENEAYRAMVVAGQGALDELQDSMSETEQDERLKSSKRKGVPKKTDPSKDLGSKEVRDKGKDALGEKQRKVEKSSYKVLGSEQGGLQQ